MEVQYVCALCLADFQALNVLESMCFLEKLVGQSFWTSIKGTNVVEFEYFCNFDFMHNLNFFLLQVQHFGLLIK